MHILYSFQLSISGSLLNPDGTAGKKFFFQHSCFKIICQSHHFYRIIFRSATLNQLRSARQTRVIFSKISKTYPLVLANRIHFKTLYFLNILKWQIELTNISSILQPNSILQMSGFCQENPLARREYHFLKKRYLCSTCHL